MAAAAAAAAAAEGRGRKGADWTLQDVMAETQVVDETEGTGEREIQPLNCFFVCKALDS